MAFVLFYFNKNRTAAASIHYRIERRETDKAKAAGNWKNGGREKRNAARDFGKNLQLQLQQLQPITDARHHSAKQPHRGFDRRRQFCTAQVERLRCVLSLVLVHLFDDGAAFFVVFRQTAQV